MGHLLTTDSPAWRGSKVCWSSICSGTLRASHRMGLRTWFTFPTWVHSAATDDGFGALSKSNTLEFFWGRECPNFGSRGFVALSKMPTLRGLGIGCKNLDDEALSTLPQFPALRELTPIGVKDGGFRHIGH